MEDTAMLPLREQIIANAKAALPLMRPELIADSSTLHVTTFATQQGICAEVSFGRHANYLVMKGLPSNSTIDALRSLLQITEQYLRHNEPNNHNNAIHGFPFPQQQQHQGVNQLPPPQSMEGNGVWAPHHIPQVQAGPSYPSIQQPYNFAGNNQYLPRSNYVTGNPPQFNGFQTNNQVRNAGHANNQPLPTFCPSPVPVPHVDRYIAAINAAAMNALFHIGDDAKPNDKRSPDLHIQTANEGTLSSNEFNNGIQASRLAPGYMPQGNPTFSHQESGVSACSTIAEYHDFICWGIKPGEQERANLLASSRDPDFEAAAAEMWRNGPTQARQLSVPGNSPPANECTDVANVAPALPGAMTAVRMPSALPAYPNAHFAPIKKEDGGKMMVPSTEYAKQFYAGPGHNPNSLLAGWPPGTVVVKNPVNEKISAWDNSTIHGPMGHGPGHVAQSIEMPTKYEQRPS